MSVITRGIFDFKIIPLLLIKLGHKLSSGP